MSKQDKIKAANDEETQPDEGPDYPLGKIICAFGVMGCGLAMLALPVSRIILPIDMLTHFSLHYMVFGGACLAGFFMPRWHLRTAIVLSVISVVAIGLLAKQKPAIAAVAPQAGEKQLRLMSYNTWLSNPNWQAVANEIKSQNPDIVTLMEFGKEKAPLLKALKAQFPYQIECHKIYYCHLAILSKIPFAQAKAVINWKGPPLIRVKLDKAAGGISLFAVHTIRPPSFRAHFTQIGALTSLINNTSGLKIVMGDFNSTPFSRTLNHFPDVTNLKRITGKPSWPTLFAQLPQLAIDHIFVSPQIKVALPEYLGADAGSDHYPINAVVNVPVK